MKRQAMFFDFDGVVLDSVSVKTDAFYEMYLPNGKDIAEKVKQYHLEHGGISRFEKFRHYEHELLGKKVDEEEIKKLGDRFSELVFEKVLRAHFIPGALEFIEKYHKLYDCYVISGTPEDELKVIVEKRALAHFFNGIYGSPMKKADILGMLLFLNGYEPTKCFYFGDAGTDLEAAHRHSVPFVLVLSPDNRHLASNSDKAVEDFKEMVI